MMIPSASGDNRQILASDAGYAMVVVMGIIAVLTVIAFGGFAMSQQALHEAGVNRQESQAFQAANGALDAAIANVRINRGGVGSSGFTMNFTAAQLGSGSASVTAQPVSAHEILLTSVGRGTDGSTETIRVRLWAMDIYGMNMATSAGFNSSAAAGSFNGNASVYGPFYTHGDLRQGDNLGNSMSGGFNWGPIFTYQGTVDVKEGYLGQVNFLYYDPIHGGDPRGVSNVSNLIPSVPRINLPRVDEAYLNERYREAEGQSTDNRRGSGVDSNTEWNSGTHTYTGALAPGARADAYKVIDNNSSMDRSRTTPYVIGDAVAFGDPSHDFAWNPTDRILTVWGTVFVDGPLEFRGGAIRYVGNGIIVANGDVTFVQTDFIPARELLEAMPPSHVLPQTMLANQKFRDGEVVGIATPGNIGLSRSSGGNYTGPDSQPTHAGAFFAGNRIWIDSRVTIVGSVISEGIEVRGNNNMDLRTSPNLGEVVSDDMPGSGMVIVSMGGWTRQ